MPHRDPKARQAYCLEQSAQCLRLAEVAGSVALADSYRRMAREYLDLAEAERKLGEETEG